MSASHGNLHQLSREGEAGTRVVARPPSRWLTRLLLPGIILVAIALLLIRTSLDTILPARAVRVVPVIVKTVAGAAGEVTVQAPGWLEPDPHPYYVTALAPGIVESILVLEGARVEAGQIVARLIDDDARLTLRRAEADLLRRRSELAAARADLEAARLQLEHLIERSRALAVALARVAGAEADVERVRAEIAVERARRDELEDEHRRKAGLVETQAVAEAAVARLRLRLDAQESIVRAAEAREAVAHAKQLEAQATLDAERSNQSLLIEERRAVARAEAAVGTAEASVALAEAQRDEAALLLARMEIRSPVAGIVMQRLAAPGSRLMSGASEHAAHVVHVYDPLHLQVRVDVPLADAAHVTVGQAVEIVVEVLPERTFTGRVTRVVHQADIQKNTIEVKVAIEDPASDLKPDMLARARFLAVVTAGRGGEVRQRVFAPEALVRRDDAGGLAALVVGGLVEDRGRVERRTVTTGGRAAEGWIEIGDGLRVGDLLIADPPPDLEPGDRVRVVGESVAGEGG